MPARYRLLLDFGRSFAYGKTSSPFSSFAGKWQASSGAKLNMRVGGPAD